MNDEDLDALAAEYVLGTLASDERAHAEALIGIDPHFAEIVHQWERRLGELNVMVEAVEPPAEVWESIKVGLGKAPLRKEGGVAPPIAPTPPASPAPVAKAEAEPEPESGASGQTADAETESETSQILSALELDLRSLQDTAEPHAEPEADAEADAEAEAQPEAEEPAEETAEEFTVEPPTPPVPPSLERGSEVYYLSRRARRWRGAALVCGALAAVLAAFIVVTQVKPGLIPAGIIHVPQLIAQSPSPPASPGTATAPGSRLVAVLQQQPSSPAFLLIIDPANRSLTVRRVSAKDVAGHSYELWLLASPTAKPLALGVIGEGEYTQAPLPADLDLQALEAASYAVSFEPAGGSQTGAPTGPILFTGRLLESVAPAPAQTPKI
jgi:anti-sigma-K factor RskA